MLPLPLVPVVASVTGISYAPILLLNKLTSTDMVLSVQVVDDEAVPEPVLPSISYVTLVLTDPEPPAPEVDEVW